MPNHLHMVTREFSWTGKVYAVERTTGEIQAMSLAQYLACDPSDLDAYEIKLDVGSARAVQWEILTKLIAEMN